VGAARPDRGRAGLSHRLPVRSADRRLRRGAEEGVDVYLAAISEPDAVSAIKLTLLAAAISVPLNLVFGIAAAWSIAKFDFRGKNLLLTFIDLPFSVSPVIAGLIFVLVFGLQGWLGEWLRDHDLKIIFALPGHRHRDDLHHLPVHRPRADPADAGAGHRAGEAARVLGAGGWQIFRRITLPNVKWALLYGVILCNARAMGEFGAVSVVSGHIRGQTNTMPLHIEILYNEYQFAAAFAVASLLAGPGAGDARAQVLRRAARRRHRPGRDGSAAMSRTAAPKANTAARSAEVLR
jgi:sulfate transport system permease protein